MQLMTGHSPSWECILLYAQLRPIIHSWLFSVFIHCVFGCFCMIGTTLGKYYIKFLAIFSVFIHCNFGCFCMIGTTLGKYYIKFLAIYQITSLEISLFGQRLFHVFFYYYFFGYFSPSFGTLSMCSLPQYTVNNGDEFLKWTSYQK